MGMQVNIQGYVVRQGDEGGGDKEGSDNNMMTSLSLLSGEMR